MKKIRKLASMKALMYLLVYQMAVASARPNSYPAVYKGGDHLHASASRHLQITLGDPSTLGRAEKNSTVSYIASLRNLASHWCGGALVAPQWIVTAAHCVDQNSPRSLHRNKTWIFIGGKAINPIKNADVRVGNKTFIHPMWSGNVSRGFDIALIKLSEPSLKSPVVLPSKNLKIPLGATLVTMGWGTDKVNGELSEQLVQAPDLELVAKDECKSAWEGSSTITYNMICVRPKSTVTGQRVCEGDSGGPLVMRTLQGGVDKRYVDVLLGVVSFSPDYCGLKKSLSHIPDVFTSAVEALKWIEETIDSESKPEADPSCNTECGSICKSPRANQLCMMACLLGNAVQCCKNDAGKLNSASSQCEGIIPSGRLQKCGKTNCFCSAKFQCKSVD